jgi:hypothetical protein
MPWAARGRRGVRGALRPPRSREARPASTDRAAETPNTTIRPLWNGPDSRLGKNSRPVTARWLAAGNFASTPVGASRCWIGFTPRTDANSDATGGSVATWWATPDGTPSRVSPLVKVDGRLLDRPAIISVKTTPMDTAVPEFWNVERIPEATPRSRAGTLPMIEEEFGEANMPLPIPFSAISRAKAQYGKFTGSSIKATKLAANTAIPQVAIPREPNLSDRMPDVGPDTRNPAVIGRRNMPAQSGVWL